MLDEAATVLGADGVVDAAEFISQGLNGPQRLFAEYGLELGEHLLDRVEIGTLGRQEEHGSAGRLDCALHGRLLMAGEIVHDDDLARMQSGEQNLFDIGQEQVAVDRTIADERRNRPSSRRPAMKVEVFQCPCGEVSISRSPRAQRPRVRTMLVLTQVSSMKTSKPGLSLG